MSLTVPFNDLCYIRTLLCLIKFAATFAPLVQCAHLMSVVLLVYLVVHHQ